MYNALLALGGVVAAGIVAVTFVTALDLWLWRQDRKARGRA